MIAGKAIYLDLAHGRAVREIVERLAAARFGIEVDTRRAIVACGEERDSLAIRGLHTLRKRLSGDRRESSTNLAACVRHGRAVQIRTRRSRACRGVWDLVRPRRHN